MSTTTKMNFTSTKFSTREYETIFVLGEQVMEFVLKTLSFQVWYRYIFNKTIQNPKQMWRERN